MLTEPVEVSNKAGFGKFEWPFRQAQRPLLMLTEPVEVSNKAGFGKLSL